jgi:serine/threonine protein kinase
MGAVYQAKDVKRQGALCAIKEMSLSMVPPEEQALAIKNFKVEAKMLSVLSHPYLPAFTHFFAENQRYFLVMEYIDGATLEDLLERNRGPFSERRVLSWAAQLCNVLEYLHSQNPPIIFRDMKPGNIMLTRQGHIKLIDFGIARFFRPTHETDTQLLGTPGYAPPEQYGATQTDERSDIYALGMSLYHLLTNRFSETGFGAKARDIRAVNPQVSVSVARALEKATALEPSDRYESVAAFRRALLGAGAFTFETGEAASEPSMLAELCARYPEEASEYLESGEIANWLRDIGEEDLSEIAWQIRANQPDPLQAVGQFLHAVLGPDVQFSSSSLHHDQNGHSQHATQWTEEDRDDADDVVLEPSNLYDADAYQDVYQPRTAAQSTLSSRSRVHTPGYSTVITVKPKTLDFGPVYPPGISAPLKIIIESPQGLQVRGTIDASDSWIRLDRTTFDSSNAYVNVQIRSSQLNSYTAYRGEIVISPEGGIPVTIVVSADIQGYAAQARRPGKTISPEDDEDDEEEWIPPNQLQQSQQMVQPAHEPVSVMALDQDALTKYGPPNETAEGWDSSMMDTKQQVRVRYGLTFTTACMAGVLWYIFQTRVLNLSALPSNPGFVLLLMGMILAVTPGAMLVGRSHTWFNHETLNRLITGISGTLLVFGLANAVLFVVSNAVGFSIDVVRLLLLLILGAVGATYSVHPVVSKRIWSWLLMVSKQANYIHASVVSVVAISGILFGYLLTVSIPPGGFTLFGMLVGIGVAAAFIGRLNHLLRLYRRP